MEINDKTGFTMNKVETKKTFSAAYLGVINTMLKSAFISASNTRAKKILEGTGLSQ